MKSLVLILLVLACSATVVNAHNGMLALFTDTLLTSCSAPLPAPYSTADVALLYIRGNGPRIGHAFEFIMYRSDPHLSVIATSWTPILTTHICNEPFTLCLGAGNDCFGRADQEVAYLGTFTFLWLSPTTAPECFIEVRENPGAVPLPGILITDCQSTLIIHYLDGGRFVFNGPCDPGPIISVEETTWGGIKQLFRNK